MKSLLAKISFLFVILIAISACKHNNCKNITCPSLQECYAGSCICADGYQGSNCDTLSYKRYIGNYLVTESCSGIPNFSGYYVHIFWQADTIHPGLIQINPLFNQGTVAAYIYNTPGNIGNNLTIPSTIVGNITVSGTGIVNTTGSIELFLTYNYNGTDYTCTEFLNK